MVEKIAYKVRFFARYYPPFARSVNIFKNRAPRPFWDPEAGRNQLFLSSKMLTSIHFFGPRNAVDVGKMFLLEFATIFFSPFLAGFWPTPPCPGGGYAAKIAKNGPKTQPPVKMSILS